MRIPKIFTAIMLILLTSALVFAQSGAKQTLLLDFMDGNQLKMVTGDGTVYNYESGGVAEGDEIPVGAMLTTGANTSAELRIKPNGTLIKLAKGTSFRVDAIATPAKNENAFTLVSGKIRTIAAKGSTYNVYTSSTVCGVRGTDFTMAFQEGAKATLLVAKGSVDFIERTAGGLGKSILISQGQFADFYTSFKPTVTTPEILAAEYGDVEIPETRIPVVAEEPPAATEPAGTTPVETVSTEPETQPAAEGDKPAAAESPVVAWLRDILGMEIGAITINGDTWAKAVIQPTFTVGKLKASLYLPIIYSKNLFDPADWYHPNGNDEWSFGTDIGWSDKPLTAFMDSVSDLALKIRYLEYGKPLDDPFFFKLGNLKTFTVGHGLIMRNYANDSDFPAVRHVGLNIGFDLGAWGFEALANDLTKPEVTGGRVFVRPVSSSKFAIGLSGIVDINPASIFNTEADPQAQDLYGSPLFIGVGADIDIPIVSTDLLGIRLFSDLGAMMPYVRNAFTFDSYTTAETGFRVDMLYDNGMFKNWGAVAGLMGNIAFVDWRLEYRYFTGTFKPAFFDGGYERKRADLVKEYASYLSGSKAIDQSPSVMGVYGEGGTSLIKDKLSLTFGYFWPWSASALTTSDMAATSDYFKAALVIKKGLVPVFDISGGITYERKNFIPTLLGNPGASVSLFDENTVFSGELIVPVPKAPNLDLAIVVSTAILRATNGDVILKNDKMQIVPVITLETRLHF